MSPFRLVAVVQAGETLDFQVGWGANEDWANDGTGLNVQVYSVERQLTASFPQVGRYVLRFNAYDSQFVGSDEVTITVVSPLNPPAITAGPDGSESAR